MALSKHSAETIMKRNIEDINNGADNKLSWIQRQFFAFYENDLPKTIIIAGKFYKHVKTFKYDFFAGTGLYELDEQMAGERGEFPRIVVKIYRYRRFFLLPMSWLGRLSALHEIRLYKMLDDIEGVPKYIADVGRTGFAHEFIPGQPLKRTSLVNDDFFDNLESLLKKIHNRNVAYVDMNKAENIILGDDGRPYLIDFQISYAPRDIPVVSILTKIILRQLQKEDLYHLLKHKRRIRPDLLTEKDIIASYNRSIPIKIHRIISKPYFIVRRFLMKLLKLKSVE